MRSKVETTLSKFRQIRNENLYEVQLYAFFIIFLFHNSAIGVIITWATDFDLDTDAYRAYKNPFFVERSLPDAGADTDPETTENRPFSTPRTRMQTMNTDPETDQETTEYRS